MSEEESDDTESATSSLIANERTKLTATYLNGIAIATFAVGGLAPIVALVSSSTQVSALTSISLLTAFCIILSGVLHLIAARHLRQLKP